MLTQRELRILLPVTVLLCCLATAYTAAMQDQDDSKEVKSEFFLKDRPATSKPPNKARYRRASKPPSETSAAIPPPGTAFAQMGVTFWRFRRSTATDKTKELVEDEEGEAEWTLERIEEGTPLAPGQKVRLSIESLSRAGYLYVIDREQYADGTVGDPKLIFPTQKTRDANRVKAGRLIYIPSATGRFTIKPSQGAKHHVGELVTVLVSSQQLIDPAQLSTKAIALSRQQLEVWEKQWGAAATRFEMEGGVGQTMTEKEQTAGTDRAPELTQDDPVPQTVYRLAIKPDSPIVLNVPLRFRQ